MVSGGLTLGHMREVILFLSEEKRGRRDQSVKFIKKIREDL